MKKETRLKKQLITSKEWIGRARRTLEPQFLNNMGLLYLVVAVEQTIKLIKLQNEK